MNRFYASYFIVGAFIDQTTKTRMYRKIVDFSLFSLPPSPLLALLHTLMYFTFVLAGSETKGEKVMRVRTCSIISFASNYAKLISIS